MASKSLASDVNMRTKIPLGELLRYRVCGELVEFIICNKFSDSYRSQFFINCSFAIFRMGLKWLVKVWQLTLI